MCLLIVPVCETEALTTTPRRDPQLRCSTSERKTGLFSLPSGFVYFPTILRRSACYCCCLFDYCDMIDLEQRTCILSDWAGVVDGKIDPVFWPPQFAGVLEIAGGREKPRRSA
jgi:hypothetical protein